MPPPAHSARADAMSEPIEPRQAADLARLYGRQVFHAAHRILGDAGLAEDVQQDVFLRLLEAPVGAVDSWPAWLCTAATRLAIDRLRRAHRWRRLLPVFAAGEQAATRRPESEAAGSERARRLRSALGLLPRLQAQCFALRCIHGLDIADIAQALSITPNHARVALHRAAQRLERQLGADAAPSGPEETSR